MKQVCLKTASWIFVLMLIVPGSVLHAEDPPSSQDQAVRDGQPASTAPVPPALRQALASSLGKAASFGAKAIPAPPHSVKRLRLAQRRSLLRRLAAGA